MQRVDATKYGNEAALHILGAISLFEVRDPETDALVSYDVEPDIDLKGYADAVEAASKAPVPSSVSSAQAKIQLRRAGLRDRVDAAVQAAGGETLDWFTDARTWERDNPYVADIGASLGLKPADVDALFIEAAKIAA